jgi:predicted subunit of tRNA(5-methylaminomethyl-2-thiouridylate) methyltransferase
MGNMRVVQVVSAAGLASKHEPKSDYECEIAALLQEAGHHSAQAAAKVQLTARSLCSSVPVLLTSLFECVCS